MKDQIRTVYKVTFKNSKVYIGSTINYKICYFGNAACRLLEKDFSPEELSNFTVRKEILWQSKTAPIGHVRRIEEQLILEYRSNEFPYGYNLRPAFKPK